MPRPNKPRLIGAEARMRENVLRILTDRERSTAWLARKMNEQGCPVNSAAMWKALHRDRTIYVDEAVAIAAVLGVSISDLAK